MARVTTSRIPKKLRACANPLVDEDGYQKYPSWPKRKLNEYPCLETIDVRGRLPYIETVMKPMVRREEHTPWPHKRTVS